MSRTEPHNLLVRGAARVRWMRMLAWCVAALLVGVASAATLHRAGVSVWLGLLSVAFTGAIAAWLIRRRPVTPFTIAHHLDRVVPQLEESSALLLGCDDSLPSRLQRARVRDVFVAAHVPPLPVPTARAALGVSAAALVITAAAIAIPLRATPEEARPIAVDTPDEPLAITSVRVRWAPPAYTGRSARTSTTLNTTVEDGSVVTWELRAAAASTAHLVTSAGDTVPMTRANELWTASQPVTRALLWHVVAERDTARVRSDDHLLAMTPDHPPLLSVIAPPSRMAIEWTGPHLVDVRALVSDDYGIGAMRLIATVASGRGEGVKFRERVLGVEVESRRDARTVVVTQRVHLDSLAVAPGDDVLLAFEATDRRAPNPQVARSETIFISMLDTLDASTATLPGISLRVEPAYFRSQRQIIIDTETLLRDIRRGAAGESLRRSMDIGYEQHLLRLRYGELIGEETEGMGDEHAHDDDAPVTAEDFLHNHDMAENATLLGASVKTLLKRALTAMWESEKQLRTGNARAALPYEYRALEALEEIRRASRAYVKRIGFEPPAIDIAKTRLTRAATGLASLRSLAPTPPADLDAPLRDALGLLDAPRSPAHREALEAAGQRLAERAVISNPTRHLETLHALRRLLDGCEACAPDVRRGLLAALPAPPPPIRPRTAPAPR